MATNKAQRLRSLKSAGRPPNPKLPDDSYSEKLPMGDDSAAKTQGEQFRRFDWFPVFQEVKERFIWRKAAYIAWSAAPRRRRQPYTEEEFASLLGYRSSRIFRKWKAEDTAMKPEIDRLRLAPLDENLADVIGVWIESALLPGREGHQDRKLFLERAGLLGESDAVGDDEALWVEVAESDG